ncbi:hypothetical protein [Christiangramia portivictoriae]|uniref:hypothetical protein n=1 Tax=Christiangramia portivictoriae TaxID=326069 RepID=UPI0004069EF4|nr:hypothetical protein [Christiangramia portivictoriae]
MKKFIIIIFAIMLSFGAQSQDIIQLDETRINFSPTADLIFEDYPNGMVKVKEKFAAQFQSNAIGFAKANFDVHRFIDEADIQSGDVVVTLRSNKGYLEATYDEKGNLLKTSQVFKDIALPALVRNEIFGEYMGWTMTRNKYQARGLRDQLDEEKYIVVLRKGNDRQRLKIIPSKYDYGVASIEKF